MPQTVPTKGNLMAVKRSLALAQMGFDLMDRKRNILIREMMLLIDKASELQAQIDSVFAEAYSALQFANIMLGTIDNIGDAVDFDDSVVIRTRSVMGVDIPSVSITQGELRPEYGFAATDSTLDEVYIRFRRVKELICKLAETENTIYRLAYAIKKTQKRANALQNIIIPNFTNTVKYINDALEEKEREEFVRLKVIKRKN